MNDFRKGVVKGFVTVSVIFLIALALFFIANYIYVAFASHNVTSIAHSAATTVNTNQTNYILNISFSFIGTSNVTNITIDAGRAGFINFTLNTSIVCPGTNQSTFMDVSIPATGIAMCYNATSGNSSLSAGRYNISIKNLQANNVPGNKTIELNLTSSTGDVTTNTTSILFLALDASATVNDTESIVSRQKSYNFTITNNASAGGSEDTIKEVTIDYTGAGFDDPGSGNITCAGPGGSWTLTNNSALNRIVCTAPGGGELAAGASALSIIIQRWGATGTAGTNRFNIMVNGTTGGGTFNVSAETRPTVTTVGTFTITRKGVGPAQRPVSSDGIAVLQLNFSTTGEGANITVVNVTRQGSATDNEVFNISLVNDTDISGTFNAGDVIISGSANALNTSSAGVYTFSGFQFNITSGGSKTLFVVVSINTTTVAGGRTFNFTLNDTGDVNVTTATTNKNFTGTSNITITNTTSASSLTTITGTLSVTGRSLAPSTKVINTANLTLLQLNFTANGEAINITEINISRTGSATDTDVVNVRLVNDTNGNGQFDVSDNQLGAENSTTLAPGFYQFRGFQYNVTTSGVNTLFVVANISAATGGRTFNLSLNGTGSIAAITGITNQSIGGTTNVTLTTTQAALTTTIHGTLSVVGKALNSNTTAINTRGIAVLLLNFTANGEQVNITRLNISRTGTATDTDGIFNVTLYNDTDRSGTFNAGDSATGRVGINTTTNGFYIFNFSSEWYNISTVGSSLLVVVSTNGSTSTGGKTFNLSLNSTVNIEAFTASSNVNLTGSSNITLTTTNGNLTMIFGALNLSAADLAFANADNGQLNVSTMRLAFTATSENMNITIINITLNNSGGMNDVDISRALLYNDTDGNGILSTGDQILAPGSASVNNQTRFIINFTALTGSTTVFIVGFDIGSSAAGNGVLDAFLGEAGNITAVGATSGIGITATGAPASPAGSTTIKTLSATATVCIGDPCTSTSTRILDNNTYNFTITNGGGAADVINQIIINYADSGYQDPALGNIICPTISGGTWNRELNTVNKIILCSNNTQTNSLGVGAKANVTINGFIPSATSAGSKFFNVTVRGGANGTFLITSSKPTVTVSGLLNITGTSLAPATKAVGSVNVSIIRLNFTASGEQMNVTMINVSLNGSAVQGDIFNVRLINDTDLSGTFNAGDTILGSPRNTTTAGSYEFTGFQFNVVTSANQSLIVLVDINTTSNNGGRNFMFNINNTNFVTTTGGLTGTSVIENLTSTSSNVLTIHGKLTVTGKSLAASTIGLNTSGVSILQLNFTASGEAMNIKSFNISRLSSSSTRLVDGDIFNVTLYNDTDLSGTFNAGDVTIGNTVGQNITLAGGLYLFNVTQLNVSAGSDKTLFVVVTINDTGAGRNFNLSLNATGNINVQTETSNLNITATSNITLTNTESSTTTIVGGFTITGKNLAPSTKVINTSGLPVLQLNFSATGEGMNITVIKITRKGTAADGHIFNVTLYNDTNLSGIFDSGDVAIGTVGVNTTTASQYMFTGFQYDIPSGGSKTLFVVATINDTAGRTFNLSLNSTEDINTISGTTNQNVTETITSAESTETTIHGTLTATGKTIAPATKAVNTANLAVLQLNFTAAGEAMNVSLINFSLVGTATEANLTNVRLFNDTNGNGQFDSGTDTLISPVLNTTSGALVRFTDLTHIVNTGGVNTLFVVVNISGTGGAGGKTFNFSINTTGDIQVVGRSSFLNLTASTNVTLTNTSSNVVTTIHGTVSIVGKSLALAATTPPTANFSVLLLNFTVIGETVNITQINMTRSGSATDGNFTNARIFNDTDLSGTFSGGDEQLFGALSSSDGGEYRFNGTQFNVSHGASKSLIFVINITSTATGGTTFNFSLAATNDIHVATLSSAQNLTGTTNITLTTTESSTTTINAIVITGTDLIAADANKKSDRGFYAIPSNEANIAVLRLNFSATGEGMNITVIKLLRGNGTGNAASDVHIINVRLFNDTNANGRFDSSADTQIGSTLNTIGTAQKYEFSGFQYNVITSGVNTLFVVFNTSDASWNPDVTFNLSLPSTDDINSIGAVTASNLSETLTTTLISTTRITQTGWYNWSVNGLAPVLSAGWNDLSIPQQSILESTGRNASNTGNFNFTSILSSLGSNWRYMYYNINGSSTGWVLADRTDPGGSTLQYVNNTNDKPYRINMTASDRFEL